MTARRPTLEFLRIEVGEPPFHSEWFWRFLASNGRETGRASETYKNRVDCIRSAELTTGCERVREYETEGICYRTVWAVNGPVDFAQMETVNVRWIK
jgi:hypothetical protein